MEGPRASAEGLTSQHTQHTQNASAGLEGICHHSGLSATNSSITPEDSFHKRGQKQAASVEKAKAPHSSTLAWKIPWMEEPGRLQSMGSRRVGHD